MGVLAERICGCKRAALADQRRARLIEQHVCRRLAIERNNERLSRLRVAVATITGGRRSIEVVKILQPKQKDPLLIYGTKKPHGSEPWSAQKASQLGLGPQVLDVSDDGTILEEFFPANLNIRNRTPRPNERHCYAENLKDFFLAFIRVAEDELVCHKDERPEHIFILGQRKDIRPGLIDWGRAGVWPLQRFQEWGSRQFSWFYEHLSFHRPAIWRVFVNCLAASFPRQLEPRVLSEAYAGFVEDQTWHLAGGPRKKLALRFLEFSVRCGRLRLDLDRLNEFADKYGNCRGADLARAYEQHGKQVLGLTK